ncbi:PilN domain-containing protein [Pseudoxanthomonas sp. PXM03]|uniref:PilN domain-containing protein n=1 Tax=Pseudoxanthomonas sp. PXM03 TaxID=2769284 RepID=UPI00177B6BE0|nr:PilN domain-containing protein [Pseudoxanthomonas sp. PXM03]MBD9436987.1 PilN domain-containing protein [Pseudoxanthomonas sp. PXM03]
MARINLLPWRAERRVQRQREFYVMLGAAAIAGLLLSFLLWFHYDGQVSGQTKRNDFLKDEIAKVQAQNKEIERLDEQKRRLLARKDVIEKLQANRSQMVHLFDSLVRTIPDGVMLANIKQEGEVLTLQGRAQSNARVSTYMRNLETSGWMTKPELSIIEAKPEEVKTLTNTGAGSALPYVFTLQVRLANPTAEQEAESAAAGAAPADPNAPATTPAPAAPLEGQPSAPAPATPAAPAPATPTPAAPAVSSPQASGSNT